MDFSTLTLLDAVYFAGLAFLAGLFTGLGIFIASHIVKPNRTLYYDNLDKPNAK